MSGSEPVEGPRRRRLRRPVATGVVLLGIAGLGVLWLERRPIASDYIDRFLAERHVPARYRIADLGLNRQRLTDVVIGDPARPDLVADWIELRPAMGWSGPYIAAVRAGHVRINARMVDGNLSLGTLDRLLPAPSGKPLTLPAIDVAIADARIALATPQGAVALRLRGQGRLDGGFAGQLTARADRLAQGPCTARQLAATLALRVENGRPSLSGPLRAGALVCGETRARGAAMALTASLAPDFTAWRGRAALRLAELQHPAGRIEALRGHTAFAGSAADTGGTATLVSGAFAAPSLSGAALTADGHYRLSARGVAFDGKVGMRRAALASALQSRLTAFGASGQGTPVGPLVHRLAGASIAAARDFDLAADIGAAQAGARGQVTLKRLTLASPSGARIALGGGGVRYAWPGGETRIAATLTAGGGGLPDVRVELAQNSAAGPITGTAVIQPYSAGEARLALAPIRFRSAGNSVRGSTTATLSGPLGDGRVDGLSLALDVDWNGSAGLVVNPRCAPLGFDRLATAGMVLRPAHMSLCPVDGGLLRLAGGELRGGALLAAPAFTGTLGAQPITLAADRAELRLADRRFQLLAPNVRLGADEDATHLAFIGIDGGYGDGALGGAFTGGRGALVNVPLDLSAADGNWTVRNGQLHLSGTLTVADAAPEPRFVPLAAQNVALALVDGRITATGRLVHPGKAVAVADVAIVHDLAKGSGRADLAVPGITFGKAFQPDDLTRLTFGIIADVNGTVAGDGRIDWTPQGVTSSGTFRTANIDLAAALGPVTGIAGAIHFTDLLNLESAPGQVVTIKAINPGISVNDGTIRFQTLRGARVQVEDGRWPFAGGDLVLDPTLLDFSEVQDRRMTFRVTGMDAGQFLQQFDFKNLNATGTFDGTLPIVFGADGGRIENGRLNVRPGRGGTIAYVGEVSQEDVGFWGNLAFQSLKSLRYRDLSIVMNGALAGEVITEVRFAGIGQGEGAKRNFLLDRLQKLPLVFNVRIKAPFRQLIDSAQSFYDPSRLIERNLPALLEEQERRNRPQPSVQPR